MARSAARPLPASASAPSEATLPTTSSSSAPPATRSRRRTNGGGKSGGGGRDEALRELLAALKAAQEGEFSVRLPASAEDELLADVAQAFNQVVSLNERLADEMVRVERVVGREGRMNERVSLGEVRGGWSTSVSSINTLIGDLVQPTAEVARVISAVAEGDFTQRMALEIDEQPVKGEFLRIGTTVNSVVDQLSSFAAEVTRVAREVGTDGKLGGQAELPDAAGIWRDLTDNVNLMASNLTSQVRNIAEVSTAVAKGDLSKKITVDARGEVLELKNTFNTMVDQLNSFAAEVTRVAYEVGTDGKLGGQARVPGVSGIWKDLTDNVNFMASNLTSQVRNIALVTTAVANGDLSKKITVDVKGEILELKNTINTMVDQLNSFAAEVTRVARDVGTEGKLGGQAEVEGVAGTWKDLTDNVNFMATNLTTQVRGIARVVTAVANGDLSQRLKVQAKGEIAELAETINNMTDTLGVFAEQVTDVARTVGVEGKLGAQAEVPGVAGTWKDLTDNVNLLANNLTAQVRNIAEVTTAVARGDLSRKITVDAKGEVSELKNTINTMVDQLNSFGAEVTRVAREVGTEGKLGGQAQVPGVSGIWKDLTDNVNFMASNLTTQVRGIVKVVTAVANGDLTRRLVLDAKGEIAALAETLNAMTKTLGIFAQQVTTVARTVGVEGKLGAQADVPGVAGTWKDLTDNVNLLANNLTAQVRNIAEVTTAVARGDLSRKITVDAKGEVFELKNTINTMVDQLNSFASEVTRLAREVGTEGKLGGEARVPGVSGIWKDLTDNVNILAGNLTDQVRDIAKVATAVANGDLSQKITVSVQGEILQLENTINTMVDQLNSFGSEVTRVAREVGTDGKLGGQAIVKGVFGIWKDLTDNVNVMASNLTDQVRNISKVTSAISNGDLSQKITVEAKGEVQELKNTINMTVEQLRSFAAEVTRVAREVGTEGKLGGQADVRGVSGVWKDLTDNVNFMARNLTDQVRNIAKVSNAIAFGDLSQKISVEAQGEILELKSTINTMVDQLRSFAAEVTRVAKEVGSEGKLAGQAQVPGVSGTWKDLTDNVNSMARNLTDQVRNIALVTTAVANGDLSKKITVDVKGEILELKNTINTMVDQLNSFASEVTRVAREVGTEGKLGGQAEVQGVAGIWKNLTDNVNFMARNLTTQVRGIVRVVTAVANGDLKQKLAVDAKGEVAALADTINSMTDTLWTFAEQVSTVAREVGIEGKLGGQARVPGVSGTWKDLTDNVNQMATNLTTQVRGIVRVVTAVATGDLIQKLAVDAKGEVAALADTINSMTTTLNTFAEQVSTVAREVGIEGKLGGQAKVPGAKGTWRQLTDNVNQLAANLTTQVRAIADVATAVTKGDLTRSITVEAQGEVEQLKRNINQMIVNLKETTQKNAEQDWLKTNLARFSGMMQGQKSLDTVARLLMSELTPLVGAHLGAFFMMDVDSGVPLLKLTSTYAYRERKSVNNRFRLGEGLVGQCALEKKPILLTRVPSDYIQISSGLGEAPPLNIIVLPVLFEGEVKAVIELASFHAFSAIHQLFLDQLMESIGVVLNMIAASMRTEQLLLQSQGLTQELQNQSRELTEQQDELKRTNVALEKQALELEEKAKLLEEQNAKVEIKNREVEQARHSLEEKAEQLALASKYKNEFLANMSHELRTPLNSLLILAKLLSENKEGTLTEKQMEAARTIFSAGGDLLSLINEILDLAKVESGKMQVEPRDVRMTELREFVERNFAPVAEQKGLDFQIEVAEDAPASLETDPQRLTQVLRNLLANAFKFTESGSVKLRISEVSHLRSGLTREGLVRADQVLAFEVVDTGIGIPKDKQRIIFEAFQQADGTTSRKYGGTGLGLSISRDIATLLGGEIRVDSAPGQGSTFTLFLPDRYAPLRIERREDEPPADVAHADVVLRRRPIVVAPEELVKQLQVLDDLDVMAVTGAEPALAALEAEEGDALVIDLATPDLDALALVRRLRADERHRAVPVLAFGDEAQLAEQRAELEAYEVSVVDRARGTEEIARFARESVHQRVDAPDAADVLGRNLAGRTVLVVDDDVRNIFAVTSILEEHDVRVVHATNGRAGIEALDKHPDVDAVLMDIMMPEMDGYETMTVIRSNPRYQALPIIAVTAKALKEDQDKCLKAGASDYLPKPVEPDRLVSLLRLWAGRVKE